MDGKANPLMDRTLVGALGFLSLFVSLCLSRSLPLSFHLALSVQHLSGCLSLCNIFLRISVGLSVSICLSPSHALYHLHLRFLVHVYIYIYHIIVSYTTHNFTGK